MRTSSISNDFFHWSVASKNHAKKHHYQKTNSIFFYCIHTQVVLTNILSDDNQTEIVLFHSNQYQKNS